MNNLEKLYEAFGDMLYVVAMADGIIQEEEVEALDRITKNHTWASDINWAFNYNKQINESADFLYKKVINICHEFGPNPEYKYLIEILEELAKASGGVDTKEKEVINKFTKDLTQRFIADLDKADLLEKIRNNKLD